MATSTVGLGIWLGGIALYWSLHPLLWSQARGVLVLGIMTGMLTLIGGLTSLQFLVVWGGGLGLCNLTLALMLASQPPNLWVGLSAGITLLALLDGSQRFTYLRHCHIEPRVMAALLQVFVRLSGLSLAAGLTLSGLVIALGTYGAGFSVPGLLTIAGACMLAGFLAVFLLYTSRPCQLSQRGHGPSVGPWGGSPFTSRDVEAERHG
jgi:hypothetical protein